MLRNSVIRLQLAIRTRLSMTMPISLHTSRYFSVSHYGRKDDKDDGKEDTAKASEEKTTKTDSTTTSTEEELKTVSLKLKDLQASYLLSLADQENLRQRNTRDVTNAKDFAIQKFAKDLLDSIDILGMALESVPETFRTKESCNKQEKNEIAEQLVNLYTGVSMTESELQKTLKRYDIQVDNPIDQVFDPNRHEAVFQAPMPDKEPGTIFAVQKKGYLLKNRVLRPAQVGVVAEASG